MANISDKICRILYDEYGLEVQEISRMTTGVGGDTFLVRTSQEKFIYNIVDVNEMNHPKEEPEICSFLLDKDIAVSDFLRNKAGKFITTYDDTRVSHIQKYVEGKVFPMNEASEWFMEESLILLGKIHNALREYKQLPMGIGSNFFEYMTPEKAKKSYMHSYEVAKQRGETRILEALEIRLKFVDKIADWTCACMQPVIWEITRSFFYAEPSCADGNFDEVKFKKYVDGYCSVSSLTQYDKDNLLKLYLFQIAVCDYYAQYLSADADKKEEYLLQAEFATKVLRNTGAQFLS